MRIYVLLVLVLLSLSSITAQNSEVYKKGAPDESGIAMLQPDPADVERAASQGLKVFKILPRGMFDYENNAYDLRGGGAFYSFTNASHSYNRVPQIGFEKGMLMSGFYGPNYGLMINVGNLDISSVDLRTKEVAPLEKYIPPRYYPEVYEEAKRAREYALGGHTYRPFMPAVAGDTYILRAISFDQADSLVAFKIDRINDDGTAIVFWKPLKEFTPTPLLRFKDSEKVAAILKSPAYKGVTFTVLDNRVTLGGTIAVTEMEALNDDLSKAGISSITMKIKLTAPPAAKTK